VPGAARTFGPSEILLLSAENESKPSQLARARADPGSGKAHFAEHLLEAIFPACGLFFSGCTWRSSNV